MQQCSIANRIDRSMEKYYRTLYSSKFQQASCNWMPPIICKTFETTQELSRIMNFILSHFHLHSDSSTHFHIHKFNIFFLFFTFNHLSHAELPLFTFLSHLLSIVFHTVKFSWRACLHYPRRFRLRQMITQMYEKENSSTHEYLIHSVVWRTWLE